MSFKETWNRMNRKADQTIKEAKARRAGKTGADKNQDGEGKPRPTKHYLFFVS